MPGREEAVAHLPHRFHRQFLTLKNNLATFPVLPILEGVGHVHPADRFHAARFIRLANDEIHVHRQVEPGVEVAHILHVEDFAAVVLSFAQVVPALELHVDFLAAGLTVVVLKFHLAIDAVIE